MQQPGKFFSLQLLVLLGATSLFIGADADSLSVIGDVTIRVTDNIWQCDKINCPPTAHRCHVTKETKADDPTKLIRSNYCYNENGDIVLQAINTENLSSGFGSSFLNVTSYRNGVISTASSVHGSVYAKSASGVSVTSVKAFNTGETNVDTQQHLDQINANVQNQISQVQANVQQNLDNLNANLARQMETLNQNLKNSLNNLGNLNVHYRR